MLGQRNNLRFFAAITVISAPLLPFSFYEQIGLTEDDPFKAFWIGLFFLSLIGFVLGFLMWKVYLPEQYKRENAKQKAVV